MLDTERITICSSCGCVFGAKAARKFAPEGWESAVSVCPACKHEYEWPRQAASDPNDCLCCHTNRATICPECSDHWGEQEFCPNIKQTS